MACTGCCPGSSPDSAGWHPPGYGLQWEDHAPTGADAPSGEPPVFDLSITKILVLAVLAIVIFGPDQLPKIATQAGRALREIRRMAQGATDELKENLGPEFADFDVTDLHPKNFVRKHLMDGFDDFAEEPQVPDLSMADAGAGLPGLAPGEDPPYDTGGS